MARRWGDVTCRGDGQCGNCPSAESPGRIPGMNCTECGGSGERDGLRCTACRGTGQETLTCCPLRYATSEGDAVLQVADLARHGCMPFQPGGSLDQPAGLMDAVQFVWGLEAPRRAKAGLD